MASFGQTEELTSRLNAILQDYPQGGQILKEIIQNADDAKARNIRIILDHRSHGTQKLKFPAMSEFQGPALMIYNDGKFSAADFQSIRKIGGSYKKNDNSKIGKFGIGFNSVYHITDLPSIVSGEDLIIFDPHEKFLGDQNNNLGAGVRIKFLDPQYALSDCCEQTSPYQVFGCTMLESFDGTIFRLPLRTPEQAFCSKISKEACDVESIRQMFSSFQIEAESILLFLKYVESLRLEEWSEGNLESTLCFEVVVKNASDIRDRRSSIAQSLESGTISSNKVMESYPMEIDLIKPLSRILFRWSVCTMINFSQPNNDRRIEWAGCAVQLDHNGIPVPVEGRAFCFLPLPIMTGLPVHVNGYFELSSNRRDLWRGADVEGVGKKKVEWNIHMVTDVLPAIYAELVENNLFKDIADISCEWCSIWPLSDHYEYFWQILAENTLRNLWDRNVWWTASIGGSDVDCGSTGNYCKGSEVIVYLDEDYNARSYYNYTVQIMLKYGVPLIKLTADRLRVIERLASKH